MFNVAATKFDPFVLILCWPGIGKSLASKLAEQGLNVVLVALQDGLLNATFAELQAQFPKQSFRKAYFLPL